MGVLSQTVRDAMRTRANQVRENVNKGQQGAFTRMWQLQGPNTIVAPGSSVIVRNLPRWDRYTVKDNKIVSDPAALERWVYVPALEHWWDGADGKRRREWCPKTFGAEQPCPICEAIVDLRASGSKDDRELAKDMRAQEVFLFNAVVGPAGRRNTAAEGGLVDIRPIAFHGTIFLQISDIMTGGEQESFARGDITDPADGYDLVLKRPGGKGGRWEVDCAPNASRMFVEAEKPAWSRWWERIPNLDDVLEKETKSYEDLYKEFHGVIPEGGGEPTGGQDATGAGAPVVGDADLGGSDDLGLGDLGDLGGPEPMVPAAPAPVAPTRMAAGRTAGGSGKPFGAPGRGRR